jgi:hypothetical protein
MELNKVMSDCCNQEIIFIGLKRIDNRTFGLYQCPKCNGVYER